MSKFKQQHPRVSRMPTRANAPVGKTVETMEKEVTVTLAILFPRRDIADHWMRTHENPFIVVMKRDKRVKTLYGCGLMLEENTAFHVLVVSKREVEQALRGTKYKHVVLWGDEQFWSAGDYAVANHFQQQAYDRDHKWPKAVS